MMGACRAAPSVLFLREKSSHQRRAAPRYTHATRKDLPGRHRDRRRQHPRPHERRPVRRRAWPRLGMESGPRRRRPPARRSARARRARRCSPCRRVSRGLATTCRRAASSDAAACLMIRSRIAPRKSSPASDTPPARTMRSVSYAAASQVRAVVRYPAIRDRLRRAWAARTGAIRSSVSRSSSAIGRTLLP